MSDIAPDQIELIVHGLVAADHGRVPARVFANKLKQFVMALEAADVVANGQRAHEYLLAGLHASQPTAVVSEVPIDKIGSGGVPAFPTFLRAINTIKSGPDDHDEQLAGVITKVNLLASGANSKFGFAEVRSATSDVIRIDSFLKNRAYEARWKADERVWFSGTSYGSFDGILVYVDARGSLPQIKLLLSAGGKEVDCVCKRDDIDRIGSAIEKRVRVYGKVLYSSTSPLPTRVEVSSIEPVGEPGDFSRWCGAFNAFDPDEWDVGSESAP